METHGAVRATQRERLTMTTTENEMTVTGTTTPPKKRGRKPGVPKVARERKPIDPVLLAIRKKAKDEWLSELAKRRSGKLLATCCRLMDRMTNADKMLLSNCLAAVDNPLTQTLEN